eukprot:m51a1_g9369 putative telomeric repeat binding (531) ;mRNA; r:188906-190682
MAQHDDATVYHWIAEFLADHKQSALIALMEEQELLFKPMPPHVQIKIALLFLEEQLPAAGDPTAQLTLDNLKEIALSLDQITSVSTRPSPFIIRAISCSAILAAMREARRLGALETEAEGILDAWFPEPCDAPLRESLKSARNMLSLACRALSHPEVRAEAEEAEMDFEAAHPEEETVKLLRMFIDATRAELSPPFLRTVNIASACGLRRPPQAPVTDVATGVDPRVMTALSPRLRKQPQTRTQAAEPAQKRPRLEASRAALVAAWPDTDVQSFAPADLPSVLTGCMKRKPPATPAAAKNLNEATRELARRVGEDPLTASLNAAKSLPPQAARQQQQQQQPLQIDSESGDDLTAQPHQVRWGDDDSSQTVPVAPGADAIASDIDEEDMSPSKRADARRRRQWTEEEEAELRRAVMRHGEGSWATIRASGKFSGRTNIDLKDKWRNMVRRDRKIARQEALRTPLRVERVGESADEGSGNEHRTPATAPSTASKTQTTTPMRSRASQQFPATQAPADDYDVDEQFTTQAPLP